MTTNEAPSVCPNCQSTKLSTGLRSDPTIEDTRERFESAIWTHTCLLCLWSVDLSRNAYYEPASKISEHELITISNQITEVKR